MARAVYSCTKCRPVDTSIIEAYMVLVKTTESASSAESGRVSAESARAEAETERNRVFSADHAAAVSDHASASQDHAAAALDHATALQDHAYAAGDHETSLADHETAVQDHGVASQDHTVAESDHATAEADHTTAVADHATAAGDHTTAAQDHTQASSDHTLAASDHTTAAADHTTAGTDHATAASDHAASVTATVTATESATRAAAAASAAENMVDIKRGPQGNSGYQGAAGELEVVNNLTDGGEAAALSAEMGKELGEKDFQREHYPVEIDIKQLSNSATTLYINATSNVWKSSTSTTSFLLPIKPGHIYQITAGMNAARFAILSGDDRTVDATPQYATGETQIRTVQAGMSVRFTAPSDGVYLCVNKKLSGTDITPDGLVDYIPRVQYDEWMRYGWPTEINTPYEGKGFGIDANPTSQTFGEALRGLSSDKNWGFSNYIDVERAIGVRFPCNIETTASGIAAQYGAVFYNKNYEPIPEGAWLFRLAGSSRIGWVTLTVPEGASYLRYTVYRSPFSENKRIYLWGQENKEPDHPGNRYEGEKVVLDPGYGFEVMQYAATGISIPQSAALYGKYLFCVTEFTAIIYLYDIETKVMLYTLTTGIERETTNHSNQSCFGTVKYDANDMFPLLYISHARNSNGRGIIDAYRILPVLTDGEISSFTVTRVQRILLPVMTTANGLGYPNAAIDPDNNAMWIYSRNTNSGESTSGLATFTRFNTPAITSSEVTLEESDIKDSFMEKWQIYNNQGAFIHKGKLYMSRGIGNASSHNEVNVIDLYNKRCRVSRIDMYDVRAFEPEGCFYYDGKIAMISSGGAIFKIDV